MKQSVAKVISLEKIMGERQAQGNPENHRAGAILGIFLLWLECPEIALEAKPGQYVMVRCGPESVLPRPLSIHRVREGSLALLFAAYKGGKGTTWLSESKEGERLHMFGPLGNGFSISQHSGNLLLVAGGIGVAPLCFLAEEALRRKYKVTLMYGTTDKDRFGDFPEGIELIESTDDGSVGYKGFMTDLLPEYAGRADQIFACGPLPMYRALTKMPSLKNKPVQVSLEVRMACGRGVCNGCTITTKNGLKKVCDDGPVFEMNEVIWNEL